MLLHMPSSVAPLLEGQSHRKFKMHLFCCSLKPLFTLVSHYSSWCSGEVVTPTYLWCEITEAFREADKFRIHSFNTAKWSKFWCCFYSTNRGQTKSGWKKKEWKCVSSWSVRQLSERLQKTMGIYTYIGHGFLVMNKQGTFHWQHVFNKTFVHRPKFSLPVIFMDCVSQCY